MSKNAATNKIPLQDTIQACLVALRAGNDPKSIPEWKTLSRSEKRQAIQLLSGHVRTVDKTSESCIDSRTESSSVKNACSNDVVKSIRNTSMPTASVNSNDRKNCCVSMNSTDTQVALTTNDIIHTSSILVTTAQTSYDSTSVSIGYFCDTGTNAPSDSTQYPTSTVMESHVIASTDIAPSVVLNASMDESSRSSEKNYQDMVPTPQTTSIKATSVTYTDTTHASKVLGSTTTTEKASMRPTHASKVLGCTTTTAETSIHPTHASTLVSSSTTTESSMHTTHTSKLVRSSTTTESSTNQISQRRNPVSFRPFTSITNGSVFDQHLQYVLKKDGPILRPTNMLQSQNYTPVDVSKQTNKYANTPDYLLQDKKKSKKAIPRRKYYLVHELLPCNYYRSTASTKMPYLSDIAEFLWQQHQDELEETETSDTESELDTTSEMDDTRAKNIFLHSTATKKRVFQLSDTISTIKESTNFIPEIRAMMYGFGDSRFPGYKSAMILEQDLKTWIHTTIKLMRTVLKRDTLRLQDFLKIMPDQVRVYFRWKTMKTMSRDRYKIPKSSKYTRNVGKQKNVGNTNTRTTMHQDLSDSSDNDTSDASDNNASSVESSATELSTFEDDFSEDDTSSGVETSSQDGIDCSNQAEDSNQSRTDHTNETDDLRHDDTRDEADDSGQFGEMDTTDEADDSRLIGMDSTVEAGDLACDSRNNTKATNSSLYESKNIKQEQQIGNTSTRRNINMTATSRIKPTDLDITNKNNTDVDTISISRIDTETPSIQNVHMDKMYQSSSMYDENTVSNDKIHPIDKDDRDSEANAEEKRQVAILSFQASEAIRNGQIWQNDDINASTDQSILSNTNSDQNPLHELWQSAWDTFKIRLRFANFRSRGMTSVRYAEYSKAREAHFLATRHLVESFQNLIPSPSVGKVVLQLISYLCYDRIGTVVECANRLVHDGGLKVSTTAIPSSAYSVAIAALPRCPFELLDKYEYEQQRQALIFKSKQEAMAAAAMRSQVSQEMKQAKHLAQKQQKQFQQRGRAHDDQDMSARIAQALQSDASSTRNNFDLANKTMSMAGTDYTLHDGNVSQDCRSNTSNTDVAISSCDQQCTQMTDTTVSDNIQDNSKFLPSSNGDIDKPRLPLTRLRSPLVRSPATEATKRTKRFTPIKPAAKNNSKRLRKL